MRHAWHKVERIRVPIESSSSPRASPALPPAIHLGGKSHLGTRDALLKRGYRLNPMIVDTFRAGPRVMVQFLPTETVAPTPLKGDRKVLRSKWGVFSLSSDKTSHRSRFTPGTHNRLHHCIIANRFASNRFASNRFAMMQCYEDDSGRVSPFQPVRTWESCFKF